MRSSLLTSTKALAKALGYFDEMKGMECCRPNIVTYKLLGEDFPDSRIVEKVLMTLPERFESKISSLEESKDLSTIALAELMSVLQAQEQKRALRQNRITKGSFQM
ncbi:hypothetical protein F0562_003307 [Nyssa sinensis]|uniref:Gag-pol polyprotein n=1 Tax=Nyssa sinensis TaxID=561372 RepID=A0A5J5BVN4_9ASTE|nr:hypothetical protein F0562_003307 [Nyssa sinensis]